MREATNKIKKYCQFPFRDEILVNLQTFFSVAAIIQSFNLTIIKVMFVYLLSHVSLIYRSLKNKNKKGT